MALSASDFAAIVGPAGERAGAWHGKRRAQRVPMGCRVPVRVNGGRAALVTVHDLSPRGISLSHATPLPAGSQFTIELNRRDGSPTVLLCMVVHCRPIGSREHLIGAEFTCVADAADAAPPAAADDQRRRISRSILD